MASQTARWIAGFRSAVISPYERIKLTEPHEFADQTLRQVLHLAGGGEQIRVHLTNRYGRTPLVVGAARVALRKNADQIVPETDRTLRFDGAERVTVPAGGELISDPIDLAVEADDDLLLSLYLPEPTGLATFSHMPTEIAYVAAGDHTAATEVPGAQAIPARFFVSGVDVLAPAETEIAVAFGDSWFEGFGSTIGANHRSVDVLNERMSRGWVVNQGIGGNRLLTDEIGEGGMDRFERDARDVPGVRHVIVHFGINDLILGGLGDQPPATATELIAGFTELARRAHDAGLSIHVGTIGPYAGCVYEGPTVFETLDTRREVNEWLRGTDIFDSLFDVDRAVADPERPDYIRPEFDSGDGMHLNDAGARAMAEAVDLAAIFG
ncbi:GDSL-type esterase/lipase family protein [Nocardia amikacinitolerans]|uniref:GDSL-type esterase/lipase family protein n=1 Tax=Nocardia amikacinitolerans TaxID=756689 RepID=UPI0020A40933|nr:GDSL-type esterase/lipase family protein [Nocardia amikacinitolerans]MCP2290861.1 Lysophospholipase L1 [Nocardia amikacinitolerans]